MILRSPIGDRHNLEGVGLCYGAQITMYDSVLYDDMIYLSLTETS